MTRIGIISENHQNDACAFKAFLTSQYEGKIEFIPLYKGHDGAPPVAKILRTMPNDIQKHKLDALLCMLDLDQEAKRTERNLWFRAIQKGVSVKSIFFLAVMELEALILADIDTFNKKYGVTIQYTQNPKFEQDPKRFLMEKTEKPKAKTKYQEHDAFEIFKKLNFDVVYKKHKDEDSFQAFIDRFEEEFEITPTTKEKLKKISGKKW